jgi:hypothetical protein
MKITTTSPSVLVVLTLSIALQCATAKPAPHQRHPQLSKPLTPILDPSGIQKPTYFHIRVEQKQYIYLKAETAILHGGAKTVDLSARAKGSLLRGGATKNELRTTISTREHGLKPRFLVDLHELTAKSAPEISRLMESEIAAARQKMADNVTRQERLMDAKLQALSPKTDVPTVPLRTTASRSETTALESSVAQSKQNKQLDSRQASQQMIAALSHARESRETMPVIPMAPHIVPPTTKVASPTRMIPTTTKTNTSDSERLMKAELAKSKEQVPSDSEVNAALTQARNKAQATVSQTQPALDTLLTSLRTIPTLRIPSASKDEPAGNGDTASVIEWDRWHAHFAKLARDPILKCLKKSGYPSGANTVEITVQADHKVSARLAKAANSGFDQAMLQAYKSLDRNPTLEFPTGSRRAAITFLIDNKHSGNGVPSEVKSQTSVGDKEILRSRR